MTRKLAPRILNIKQMWDLHLLISNGISKDMKGNLMQESSNILQKLSEFQFNQSLKLFYGNKYIGKNPIEIVVLFVRGLKRNNTFSFEDFIRKFS